MSERVNKALRTLVRKEGMKSIPVITGEITAVNGSLCDVQPNDGGALLYDVRLKVAVNNDGMGAWSVPQVGSQVIVAMLDAQPNSLVVIQVETIAEHVVRIDGNAELRLKANGQVSINGEQFGGLVKVEELRSELQKINTFLTTLRQAVAATVIAPGDGGAALKTGITTAISSLQLPTYTNIESDKTKHGSL